MKICPDRGSKNLDIKFIIVDFPAPLCPTIATLEQGLIKKLILLNTGNLGS